MRKYFQSMLFELDCGHIHTEHTSFMRLSRDRAAVIAGGVIGKPVGCWKCGQKSVPVLYLRNEPGRLASDDGFRT